MNNLGLKKGILIPLMVSAILFLLIIIAVSYYSHIKNLQDDIQRSAISVQGYFERSLHRHGEKLSSIFTVFNMENNLLAALKAKKQKDISMLISPFFEFLRKNHHVTDFNIYGPDLVNLFRARKSSANGETTAGFTVLEANRTNKMFSGIELGRSGAITMNTVIPLYDGQTVSGYAEFCEEIGHIIKDIKEIFHVDLYVLIKKRYLKQSEWEEFAGMSDGYSKWDLLPSSVISAGSSDIIPVGILKAPLLPESDPDSSNYIRQVIDGNNYAAKAISLKDAGNREIGNIVMVRNIASMVKKMRLDLVLLGVLIIVIGSLTLLLFYFILGRVEDNMTAMHVKRLEEGKKILSIQAKHIIEMRHKQEELQRLKDEAEELNRLKSDFLNIMSHELKTPLTVMLGNMPLLTDENDLPEPVEIADIARDVENAAEHLLELINDLLDISKIDAGKMKLQKGPVCAASVVEEVVSTARASADEKGLEIRTEVEDIDVSADHQRLKQIIQNLFSNAVKFTDAGSITIKVTGGDNEARFQVIDTGSGMEEDNLPFIFDVFRQIDSSSARSAQGTGLGLTITKRLVEMHGGEISVNTEPGVGSTFTFSVPLSSSSE